MYIIKNKNKKKKAQNVLSAGRNESAAIILASGLKRLSFWTDGSNEVEEEVLLTAQFCFNCYAEILCVFGHL